MLFIYTIEHYSDGKTLNTIFLNKKQTNHNKMKIQKQLICVKQFCYMLYNMNKWFGSTFHFCSFALPLSKWNFGIKTFIPLHITL